MHGRIHPDNGTGLAAMAFVSRTACIYMSNHIHTLNVCDRFSPAQSEHLTSNSVTTIRDIENYQQFSIDNVRQYL